MSIESFADYPGGAAFKSLGPVDKDLDNIQSVLNKSVIAPGTYIIEDARIMHNNEKGMKFHAIGKYLRTISVFEDMWKFGVTGYIDMLDMDNLITGDFLEGPLFYPEAVFMPLIGEKLLFLKFKTPRSKYTVDYSQHPLMIYKIENLSQEDLVDIPAAQGVYTYRLHFMSPELYWNERTRISETMEGTYSEMIEKILVKHLGTKKGIWLEPTKGRHKILASGKPFDIIRWILNRALRENENWLGLSGGAQLKLDWQPRWNNVADFLFYETTKGYKFKSQANTTLQMALSYVAYPTTESFYNMMHTILSYRFGKLPDTYEGIKTGMWGSSLTKHDMFYKTVNRYSWNYIDDWKTNPQRQWCSKTLAYHPDIMVRDKVLADGGQDFETSDTEKGRISDFPQSVGYLIGSSNKRMFTNITNGEIHYPENDNNCEMWKMQRASQMSHANHMTVSLRIHGISGLQVGDSVYLQLPRVNQYIGQGISPSYDKLFSDVWVIRKLAHRIETSKDTASYVCDLELSNARLNPLGQELPTNTEFTFTEPNSLQGADWDGPTGGTDLLEDPVVLMT